MGVSDDPHNLHFAWQSATAVGVFHPDNPQEFGVGSPPAGKARMFMYGLCSAHNVKRPAIALLIEEEIARAGENAEIRRAVQRAELETDPHERARLWGKCIEIVLSLEDIREGLTFEEIAAMSDTAANELADHMRAVFKMERPWRT